MSRKPVEIEPFLKREALAEQVVRQLVSLVQTGELKPGDKLPGERALASDLGIGRPTLREALRALQLLGILDRRHGGGTYVSNVQPDTLLGPLHLFVSLDRHNIKTILEARNVIEGAVLAFVAKSIDARFVKRLEENLSKLECLIEKTPDNQFDMQQISKMAQEFRAVIEEATGNPILTRAVKSLDILSAATRHRLNVEGAAAQLLANHKRIVEALLDHDPVAAQRALDAHIDYLGENLQAKPDEEDQ